ncbi:hypothetical protein ACH5RR_023855, partial [Cinchona calisaya]
EKTSFSKKQQDVNWISSNVISKTIPAKNFSISKENLECIREPWKSSLIVKKICSRSYRGTVAPKWVLLSYSSLGTQFFCYSIGGSQIGKVVKIDTKTAATARGRFARGLDASQVQEEREMSGYLGRETQSEFWARKDLDEGSKCLYLGYKSDQEAMRDQIEPQRQISLYDPQVVILAETMISGGRASDMCAPLLFSKSIIVDARGFKGELWVLWNHQDIQVDLISKNSRAIHTMVKFRRNGPKVSHCLFVGDIILFSSYADESLQSVKATLEDFSLRFGLTINTVKSSVFYSANTSKEIKIKAADSLGIKITNDLGNYLGFPICHKRISMSSYNFILEKLNYKLSGSKAGMISFAARRTIIQQVSSSVPTFYG